MSDLQDKVVLVKSYRDRRGNLYPAAPYERLRYELPEAIQHNPEYVQTKDNYTFIPNESPQVERVILDTGASNDDLDGRIKREFKAEIGIITTPKEVEAKLDINSADLLALVALPGVGEALAKKLMAQREKEAFSSLEDVQRRVPLPFGRSWGELNVSVKPYA